jgi:hypothetical protein
MMRLRNWLSYGNVTATVAVFLAISGTAAAVTLAPANSVVSGSIKDGEVKPVDLRDGAVSATKIQTDAVGSSKVANESLTGTDVHDDSLGGADVKESSLGEVPTATLGGLGRYGYSGSCDPENEDFDSCSIVSVATQKPARMLVIGTVRARSESGATSAAGHCRIGTNAGPIDASDDIVQTDASNGASENLTVMAVTDVFPTGANFGIECNDVAGGIEYPQARVVAVGLSGD